VCHFNVRNDTDCQRLFRFASFAKWIAIFVQVKKHEMFSMCSPIHPAPKLLIIDYVQQLLRLFLIVNVNQDRVIRQNPGILRKFIRFFLRQ
jgi:hypothetical protein